MKYNTKLNRIKDNPEENNGIRITDTAGYIPPKLQIEKMLLAGRSLREFRKYQFDFPEGTEIDETYTDITRRRNLDMAEITQHKLELESKIRDFTRKQRVKEAEDLKRLENLPETPPEPQEEE